MPVQPAAFAPTDAIAPALPGDIGIAHRLDMAQDGAWLDQLAQDISRSADPSGRLRFALAPEHLGRMTVDLAAGADGTAVRLTTETEQARRIVSDAQPRLVAEAQAQGLRITDTQVALDQSPAGQQHRHDAPTQAKADGGAGQGLQGGQGNSSSQGSGGGQGGFGAQSAPGGQGGGDRPRQTFAQPEVRRAPVSRSAEPAPAGNQLYA